MKVEIKIPSMGESVTEATISTILKPTGSFVKRDEEVIELETDKVNQVLYAPESGKITFTVKPEETVKIGQVIGYVDTDVAAPQPEAPSSSSQPSVPAQQTKVQTPLSSQPSATSKENARVMMPEFIASLEKPSQPQTPVKSAPVTQEASSSKATRKKMSTLRKVIATRLVEAKNTTAMLTTFNEVEVSFVIEIRNREKDHFQKKYGVKLGFMSFFIKGVIAALKAIPQINAYIDAEDIVTLQSYDISVAVSTEKGLMVPVLRNCDEMDFASIEKGLEAYAKKAREGTLSLEDLKGGSFTITNGGVFGSLLSTPILNPPQSAILGMHAIVKRPVVVEDNIVIRPMMYLALSYDHRIVDGKEAVQFLVHLKQSLEDPSRLLLNL